MNKSTFFWVGIYALMLFLYSLWSYSLTDPNLVLSSWQPYWQFQQWMWQTFFHNAQLLTTSFVFLITFLLISWAGLIKGLTTQLKTRQLFKLLVVLVLPLVFSYNALSHDVFNYIFNAKMVVVYQQNPHQRVALDFAQDTWTRFMHNTHTPAPYGYGWTAFSVLPFMLGLNKFTLTWVIFRLLNVVAIPFLVISLIGFAKEFNIRLHLKDMAAVVLHPLFLIEVVSNSHNDLWMLVPAVAALWLGKRAVKQKNVLLLLVSFLLLVFSISTKLATVVLLPLWLSALWGWFSLQQKKKLPKKIALWLDLLWAFCQSNCAFLASGLLFLPLLSGRSQLFHPWYLLWPLIWLPVVNARWWQSLLLVFSVSSLFRYAPWLLAGGFSDEIIRQQHAVTWLGGLFGFFIWYIWSRKQRTSL